ncbi:hypothetical protein VPH35_072655 [Triticum aestivum]
MRFGEETANYRHLSVQLEKSRRLLAIFGILTVCRIADTLLLSPPSLSSTWTKILTGNSLQTADSSLLYMPSGSACEATRSDHLVLRQLSKPRLVFLGAGGEASGGALLDDYVEETNPAISPCGFKKMDEKP